ncbi:unnamed protein product [Rotaria sp. Silwood2]|nr:unnamed protein product [Rotaria sp. Silwood2]
MGTRSCSKKTMLRFCLIHFLHIKSFLDKLGHDGFNKLRATYDDKTVYAKYVFTFCTRLRCQSVTFTACCPRCVLPASTSNTFEWDTVFQSDNKHEQSCDRTFVKIDKVIKNQSIHQSRRLILNSSKLL